MCALCHNVFFKCGVFFVSVMVLCCKKLQQQSVNVGASNGNSMELMGTSPQSQNATISPVSHSYYPPTTNAVITPEMSGYTNTYTQQPPFQTQTQSQSQFDFVAPTAPWGHVPPPAPPSVPFGSVEMQGRTSFGENMTRYRQSSAVSLNTMDFGLGFVNDFGSPFLQTNNTGGIGGNAARFSTDSNAFLQTPMLEQIEADLQAISLRMSKSKSDFSLLNLLGASNNNSRKNSFVDLKSMNDNYNDNDNDNDKQGQTNENENENENEFENTNENENENENEKDRQSDDNVKAEQNFYLKKESQDTE